MDSNVSPNIESRRMMAKVFGKTHLLQKDERFDKIPIEHIPIGETSDGKLVCLPKEFRDEPVIIICGGRGSGKTWLLHTILDRTNKYTDKNCLILNDYMNESTWWNWGWDDETRKRRLIKLNEESVPLPIMHFFPSSNSLKKEVFRRRYRYVLSIPFSTIIDHAEEYFNWKPERDKIYYYFKNAAEKFKLAKSEEEVNEIIEEEFASVSTKGNEMFASMKFKLKNIMAEVFRANYTTLTCHESVESIELKDKTTGEIMYKNDPISACYMAGIVPAIMTSDILTHERYASLFFYYILQQRWEKKELPEFRNKAEWFFIDEVNKITGKGNEKLTEYVTRGRHKRFGMVVCTQNYSTMNKFMKQNKDYTFVLRQNSDVEIKAISNDWGLKKFEEDTIQTLKTQEVLGLTTQKFFIYDRNGVPYPHTEPIKMKSLFPLSYHAPPNIMKKE